VSDVYDIREARAEIDRLNAQALDMARTISTLRGDNERLLALAHQYATECGECAGTRVQPDDEPCSECAFIWKIIDQAEGRA
jgi:hypothetical protein